MKIQKFEKAQNLRTEEDDSLTEKHVCGVEFLEAGETRRRLSNRINGEFRHIPVTRQGLSGSGSRQVHRRTNAKGFRSFRDSLVSAWETHLFP